MRSQRERNLQRSRSLCKAKESDGIPIRNNGTHWKRVHSVPGVVKKTLPNVRSDENWGRFEHPSVLVSAWKQPRVVLEKHKLIRSTSEVHRKDATVGRPRVLSSTVPEVSSTKGGRKGLPTQPRSLHTDQFSVPRMSEDLRREDALKAWGGH
jgi:hypothetical protein